MSLLNTCKAWRVSGISIAAKLVLLKLADCSNEKTGQCFPSLETIMRDTGMCKASVYNKMKELTDAGLVESSTGSDGVKRFTLKLPEIGKEPVYNLDSVYGLDESVYNLDSANRERETNGNTPLPPKGEERKPKKRRLTQKQKSRIRIPENSPLMQRIGRWFNRKPETLWTIAEAEALADLIVSQQEIEELEPFYLADLEEDWRRQDLMTLLNNWNGELDKARAWKAKNQ